MSYAGESRRDFMRVGSLGLFGVSLSKVLSLQKVQASTSALAGMKGFGSAKSVILLFLQGGPSHIDIWDPKPDAPSNIRGEFNAIKTKVPGIWLSETMPKLAGQMDKCTLIRSIELHAQGTLQPYSGHLPDADWISSRPGFAFRSTGATFTG